MQELLPDSPIEIERAARRWGVGATAVGLVATGMAGGAMYFFLAERNSIAACWGIIGSVLGALLATELLYRRDCALNNREHHQTHVKSLFVLGCFAILGGLQGACLNMVICVRVGPSALSLSGSSVALIMSFLLFVLGVVTAVVCKAYVLFDRQPKWVYQLSFVFYVLVASAAIVCVILLMLRDQQDQLTAALFCLLVAIAALVVAAESRYRNTCFFFNRPCHDHLTEIAAFGVVYVVAGLALVPYYAFLGMQWARDNHSAGEEGDFLTSPFIPFMAAVWMERWGAALCWTTWYFRSTEDSVSLLVGKSGSDGLHGSNHGISRPLILNHPDYDDDDFED